MTAGGVLLAINVVENMDASGLAPSFSFLLQEAGFDVSESLIPYDARDSYAKVILTGLINTLFVCAVSLVLANLVGLSVGLLSVGRSPLGRLLSQVYVEIFRNLPKILILLIIYVIGVNELPSVRNAVSVGHVHITNRSIYFPSVVPAAEHLLLIAATVTACLLSMLWHRRVVSYHERTGRRLPSLPVYIGLIVSLPAAAALVWQVPLEPSVPVLSGFDFTGGLRLSFQFVAVVLTLGLYHGAQIAEVLRGGIEAVPQGQRDAAAAIGLKPRQVTRLVVFPLVLRMVIPSLSNQYVNLAKNTSIAIAVGYSDLMSVAGTTINQTFRPLETMLITMGLYLALCVGMTSLLNRWNARLLAPMKGK